MSLQLRAKELENHYIVYTTINSIVTHRRPDRTVVMKVKQFVL